MSLYRRVHPTEIVWSDNDGCARPNSSVFKDEEMSVHLDDVLQNEKREPESVLSGRPTHSLVSLTTDFVKGEEQTVRRTPKSDDTSHGDVCGKKPQGRRRRFAHAARFVVLREDALEPGVLAKMRAAVEAETAAPESP